MTHPFEKQLQNAGLINTPAPKNIAGLSLAITTDGAGKSDYATAALRDECDKVANAAPRTRNHTLNSAAFSLASLVAAGHLKRSEVEDALTDAARIASSRGDHPLSDEEIESTIASGFTGSTKKVGARSIPELPTNVTEVDAATLQPAAETPEEAKDLHGIAVTRRAYDFRVNDEARILWNRQRAALTGQQQPAITNLVDLLNQPDEDANYRITDALPTGGRALLAAQYKAGKTSMIANLLRSLVDGDKFLGQFDVTPVNNIVLIDTELDERMLRRWLRDQGIRNQAAINVLSLRGRLTTFGINDDTIRADWAKAMHGADFIILDCLRPCLDALGLSEDKEAGIFLTAFDALCKESGAAEGVVVHHMGHGQERSRGDSRLLDWPDVLWKIVRDDQQENSDSGDVDRYFSAMGRDVNIPESLLDWNPQTRGLTLCGGGRAEKRARSKGADIAEILADPANKNGLSKNALVGKLKAFGNTRDSSRMAVEMAISEGLILTVDGPRNSVVHVLNPSSKP